LFGSTTILPPDFVYKQVPTPHVTIDLSVINQRLDYKSSVIMDVPHNWIDSTGSRIAANVQGSLRFVNERMKYWIRYFETITQKVILLAYGDIIQGEMNMRKRNVDSKKRLMELYADTDIEVFIPCTPIASIDDLNKLHMGGFITKEDVAPHIFDTLGVPRDNITVSAYPDMVPKELLDKTLSKTNNNKKTKTSGV
jgi:hypothetical protein